MHLFSKLLALAAFCGMSALCCQSALAVSDCLLAGVNFSDGAVSCQSGYQYQCSNGSWKPLDSACVAPPPAPTRSNPADCACTAQEQDNCGAQDRICCVALEGGSCIKRCCERP